MKRVLYIGNFAKPQNSAAGKRVYNNALALAGCGYEVLLIGTDPSNIGTQEVLTECISYVSFPNYGKHTGQKYFNWLKEYIGSLSGKPDLLIRYGSPGLALFDYYVYRYAQKQRIPLVIDVVDWLAVDGGNILFRHVKSLDTWLEKALFNKQGDGLIAISSYLHRYYAPYYKNMIILPPLVECYTPNTAVNAVPQIVYAGSPFRKGRRIKNVHVIKDRLDLVVFSFCALAAKGQVFDLHIFGLTKQEYLTAFPTHCQHVDNTPCIHFYGHQSMDCVHQRMSQMDFSILLRERNRSTMAGFPTKIVESMSLGVPVITTDTSDLTHYIKPAENGFLVTIDNFETLQKQLVEILNSSGEFVQKLKKNIYEHPVFGYQRQITPLQHFLAAVMTQKDEVKR